MANTKSAKKRARQTPKRTARNLTIKNRVKTAIRSAREAIETGSKDFQKSLSNAISTISKAGKTGTIHKRNAARKISRLMKKANVKPVAAAPTATKTKAPRASAKK